MTIRSRSDLVIKELARLATADDIVSDDPHKEIYPIYDKWIEEYGG